jgi:hypothetical protein
MNKRQSSYQTKDVEDVYSYFGHSAVLLSDDVTMVVFGGFCSTDLYESYYCNDLLLIDIVTENITTLEPSPMDTNWPSVRAYHTATYANGLMYIIGGETSTAIYYNPYGEYDGVSEFHSLTDVSKRLLFIAYCCSYGNGTQLRNFGSNWL